MPVVPENSANLLWRPHDSDGCSPGSKSPLGAFCLSIITTLSSQKIPRDQCLTCQWRDESDGRGCGEPGRAAAKATGGGKCARRAVPDPEPGGCPPAKGSQSFVTAGLWPRRCRKAKIDWPLWPWTPC